MTTHPSCVRACPRGTKSSKNHSFCEEFAEVFKSMIEKKSDPGNAQKIVWGALAPAIFQFTYKKGKTKSKNGSKKSQNTRFFLSPNVVRVCCFTGLFIFTIGDWLTDWWLIANSTTENTKRLDTPVIAIEICRWNFFSHVRCRQSDGRNREIDLGKVRFMLLGHTEGEISYMNMN